MATWAELEATAPELAALGIERLARDGVAYLATLRAEGAPRVHPIGPILAGGRVFVFMEPTSPKARDLERDPRCALHSQVADSFGTGGEFLLSGAARLVADAATRTLAAEASVIPPQDRYLLFEVEPLEALGTGAGAGQPAWLRWTGD